MNRKYLSGAEKRKHRADKKAKEVEVMLKVPKINELFAAASTSNDIEGAAAEENIVETDSSISQNVVKSMEIENETIEIVSGTMDFPSDTALWDISKNISTLQNFWIRKGND